MGRVGLANALLDDRRLAEATIPGSPYHRDPDHVFNFDNAGLAESQ